MVSNRTCRLTGFISLLLLAVAADNSVHILSEYRQLVTSSTLNWVQKGHEKSYDDIVIGGHKISQLAEGDAANNQAENSPSKKPIYVCRARYNGIWVSGGQIQDEAHCKVSLLGTVHPYDRYELLENVDNGARLSWKHWDKYIQPQVGYVAIESDERYIARHELRADEKDPMDETLGYTHYIGKYNPKDGLGTITYVKSDNTEASSDSGEVLVEIEPIYYELTMVNFIPTKERVMKENTVVLATAILSNTKSKLTKVAEGLAYSFNYTMYWGQGQGFLKGLNTSIVLANNTKLPDIEWGIKKKEKRTEVYTVEVFLEPGTAVNVTLRANYTDMETSYSGKVISHYKDGVKKSRLFKGIRQEENMINVRPEFSPIYFISNNSEVPTTIPPPTTMPPTPEPPLITEVTLQNEQDENMIVPPKEGNYVQNDGRSQPPSNVLDKNSGVFHTQITPCLIVMSVLAVIHNKFT